MVYFNRINVGYMIKVIDIRYLPAEDEFVEIVWYDTPADLKEDCLEKEFDN